MSQLRLDFDAAPRPAMPPAQRVRTSIAAAEAIAEMAGTLRGRVLDFLIERWELGATREEISAALGMKEATVCGRCNELLRMGLVFHSGTTRPTSSGRAAVVLKVKGTGTHRDQDSGLCSVGFAGEWEAVRACVLWTAGRTFAR